MGWDTARSIEAAERRELREAQKRQRELERRAKEQAKLSAIEHARLEVETYENRLEVLLSIHKQQGPEWDWAGIEASLPPVVPKRGSYHEQKLKQDLTLRELFGASEMPSKLQEAVARDDDLFRQAMQTYTNQKLNWSTLKDLAKRVLAGDLKAYAEALDKFSPLGEISELGSSVHFTFHDARLVAVVLNVNGMQAIPAEVKTLTASEKLSVKPMPKVRFHEIYQDYICGCILRVSRELFALLPVESVLVTAMADSTDGATGRGVGQPVVSVVFDRHSFTSLNFDRLDPSDAVENFHYRGDFKATRKTGAFAPIMPLDPTEIPGPTAGSKPDLDALLTEVHRKREELKVTAETLGLQLTPMPT